MEFKKGYSEINLQKFATFCFSNTVLCNSPQINNLILNIEYQERNPEFLPIINGKGYKKVESKAKELLSTFPEIGVFKNKILEMLWPATCRIIRWKVKYANTINSEFLQYFYWTNQGRIDNKRTAKYIIKNKRIPITKRFVLACSFCLEKEICEIWEDMSNDDRKILMEENSGEISPLQRFWTNRMQAERNELGSYLDAAIDWAVTIGSIDAVKYIFNLLPTDEKYNVEVACLTVFILIINDSFCYHEDFTDVGYFFLRPMINSYRIAFVNFNALAVLTLLLYPPGQKFFLYAAKKILDLRSENSVKHLLIHIIAKINADIYKDYHYIKIFVGFWQMLPEETLKKLRGDSFLECAFCKIIFQHFRYILIKTQSKKVQNRIRFAKRFLLNRDKWELLQFFIKKEIVTSESLKNNKTNVLRYLHMRKSNKPAWRRLIKFLKDNGPKKEN